MDSGNSGGAAPTGCYKCGRPGHWSRDCPSNPTPNPKPNPNTSFDYASHRTAASSSFKSSKTLLLHKSSSSENQKPKKVPRSRPKLTPDLLLSNEGIGYILRHFPHAFKYGCHGKEVSNLGKLIGLYAEWHSHLLPYYSFDQFVQKLEQIGGTKRVRKCIGDLRDRVANGGDPTRLHEPAVELHNSNHEQEAINLEDEDASLKYQDTDVLQEDILQAIYKQTTEVQPSPACRSDASAHDVCSNNSSMKEQPNKALDNIGTASNSSVSEEQRTRMQANRVKALERAAARARSSQAGIEQ